MSRLITEYKAFHACSLTCPHDAPRIQLSYVIIFVSPTMKYIADSDTESVRKLTSLTDFRMD